MRAITAQKGETKNIADSRCMGIAHFVREPRSSRKSQVCHPNAARLRVKEATTLPRTPASSPGPAGQQRLETNTSAPHMIRATSYGPGEPACTDPRQTVSGLPLVSPTNPDHAGGVLHHPRHGLRSSSPRSHRLAQEKACSLTSFHDFGLAEPITRALAQEKYVTPTPIQAQ